MTHDELVYRLDYNPETGEFTWKNPKATCMKPGDKAGSMHKSGYVHMSLNRTFWQAHRLAWFYVYGTPPVEDLDHIDGNKSNNSINNLRPVSQSVNNHNLKRARSDNSTGYLGVSPRGGQFIARIMVKGHSTLLGTFPSAEEAHAAYLTAKREVHEGNTL